VRAASLILLALRDGVARRYATVTHTKPICLTRETDPNKGGLPLVTLKQQCPKELRAELFWTDAAVPWHRASDFQLVSLKQIAERMLLASPKYMGTARGDSNRRRLVGARGSRALKERPFGE
jgi:hypothetical protein